MQLISRIIANVPENDTTPLLADNCSGFWISIAVFSARQHICYSALYAIARPSVCLSVRPSVRHTGGSVKDG